MKNKYLDSITLNGLKVFGLQSQLDSVQKQLAFELDVTVHFDMQDCIDSGSSKDSINVGVLKKTIKQEFAKKTFYCLERTAYNLIARVFLDFVLSARVDVCIRQRHTSSGDYSTVVNMSREKHDVYLALGSNLGDKRQNLLNAIQALKKIGKVGKISQFYITPPHGVVDQDEFVNAAIKFVTIDTPQSLLKQIKDIEKNIGRTKAARWGPRIIDIDILMYDNLVYNQNNLTIPHCQMHKRKFVLQPMLDIAPYAIHPVYNASIEDLWNMLEN